MNDTSREQRLEAAIAAYLEARHAGRAPPSHQWLSEHPDLADDLRRFLDNQEGLLRLGEQEAKRDALEWPTTLDGSASDRVADLGTVSYFGDYELLSEIARGGMGIVYRARQVSVKRIVALKMILAGEQASDDEMRRFRLEAEAAANLDHPGIVPIYEVGEHGSRHYYSMKLIEGTNLGKIVPDLLPDPRRAARLMAGVARAVHYAHQHGILHRDLKPANILLDTKGEPHVTDFGLALRVEGDRISVSGAIVGTPNYMPPEQARADKNLTTAGDVWSLGAILYECLTGRPPFGGANVLETLQQVVQREPDRPSAINPRADADLAVVAMKCLQKEPARRYESAAALADDLDRWGRGEPIHARAVGSMERAWRTVRRNPAIAALTAAVLFVLLAGAVVSTLLAIRAGEKADEAIENERIAREEEKRADANARKAVAEGEVAREEKKRADASARTAREKEQTAREETKRADAQRDRAEMLVYAGKLTLAQREWKDNNGVRAIEVLGECQWNLRGWEHRHLWTLYTSHNQRTFRGHMRTVWSVAFSPDGKRIVSGSWDNTLKTWDAEKGQEIRTLKGHTNSVWSVAFSPDGKRIVSGSENKTLKIWDAEKGQEIRTLEGHTSWVYSVAFSPDGKRIVSGSADKTLKIWDAEKGQVILTLEGHTKGVYSVAFSPDGKRIASGSDDNTLKLWDAEKGQVILTLKGHTGNVGNVAFSPDGKRIASGSWDTTLKIWDAEKGQVIRNLEGHTRSVSSVAFSPDGKRIVSGSNTLKIWDAEKGQEIRTREGHTSWVYSVAFSPDGKRIVSGSADKTLKIWDAEKGQVILTLEGHKESITSVAFSPDGKRIVSGSDDKRLKIWDAEKGQVILTLEGHTDRVTSVAFSPDGKRIASGSRDNTLKIWDAEKGQELLTLEGHTERISSVAFSPDGKRIVSGSSDKRLKIWDAEKGQELLTLEGHMGEVLSVAFSPDGKRIVSGGGTTFGHGDNTLKIWDAGKGQETFPLKGTNMVTSVAFSPDGKRIVSGGGTFLGFGDFTLKLWDAEKGQVIFTLKGHTREVTSVAFSPDGKHILSDDIKGKRLTWDSVTGQPIDPGTVSLPRGQKEATNRRANLRVRCDGYSVIVSRIDFIDRPEPDRTTPADMIRWHRDQAADSTAKKQWFAVAFHLEWLHRLKPFDRRIRAELAEALKETPDSPARSEVVRRLRAFDLARQVGAIGELGTPGGVLALPGLLPAGSPEP